VKISMVSEHASPLAVLGGVDAGGQNVHVSELARALGGQGVEVVVHTRRDDPRLPRVVRLARNVVVDHIDAGPPEPVPKDELIGHMESFARELSRRWTEARPDVVHSHFWMSGLASLRAAQPLGIPVVHTYHALGIVKRRQQGAADSSPAERVLVEAMIARESDHIVSTSADEAAELVHLGASPDRITVIPCGVDLGHFRPDGPHSPRSGRPRIVVLGRLVERKGIGNVIAALPDLDGVELVIAGGPSVGELESDPDVCRLRSIARQLGVEGSVEFLGAVGRDEVPGLLRSADVVACCPWYEPFGMVAVEAMACGRPVVATAVGGLAETVVDGKTGLLVPPRRPDRVARAIGSVLENPRLRRRLGRAASTRGRRYGWDRVASETLEVLSNVRSEPRELSPSLQRWSA
jgi:D-inositol-3-phosphate glycosyltransferase